jgi:RNA polymerase sigma factor (sigma-70 family)
VRRSVRNIDPELERRVRLGDRRAFELLAERHYDAVFRVANQMIRDYHLAQDLTQEALMRAFMKLGRLTQRAPFVAVVCRIARNISIDVLRRRRVGMPLSLDSLPEFHAPAFVREGAPEPDQALEIKKTAMWNAVSRLRESDRGILLLRYGRGLDMRTIATEFGITPASAKSRLHRGRRELAAKFRPAAMVSSKSPPSRRGDGWRDGDATATTSSPRRTDVRGTVASLPVPPASSSRSPR